MRRPANLFDHYETRRKIFYHLNDKDSATLVSYPGQQRCHLCVASAGNPIKGFGLLERMRGQWGEGFVERSQERPKSPWLGCVATKERPRDNYG